MAHFAKVENDVVSQVIVIDNESCQNLPFPESETIGQDFIKSIGLEGKWLQCSYNENFRKNFPGTGYVYDKNLDAFIPPKEYDSWVLNQETGRWEAPVPMPITGTNKDSRLYWDEDTKSWKYEPEE
jgi:hypothetical protein